MIKNIGIIIFPGIISLNPKLIWLFPSENNSDRKRLLDANRFMQTDPSVVISSDQRMLVLERKVEELGD